ncbi:MAG TPA: hypothetical protein VFQ61_04805 [Polyangiaceae bacterium]|nr:hypothetical protein [Polyangiaceae bacterium]
MMERFSGWYLLVIVGAAGCSGASPPSESEAAESETSQSQSERLDGLHVEAPVEVSRAVTALRSQFRQRGEAFTARGRQHEIEIGRGVTRLRRIPSSQELRSTAEARVGRVSRSKALLPPAVEIKTRSIARGSRESMTGAAAWAVARNGDALRRFERGEEHWTNLAEGAEVAYHFAERPAGAGDLVVSVDVNTGSSSPSVRSDARGLHFQMADGHRFFFEHATWVDASGKRVAVPARWKADPEHGAVELVVPAKLIEQSQYPAILDPLVGPDLGTDDPVLTQSSAGTEPDVASDGSNFMAVFGDLQRIRAVRVDASGHVLDANWLDLGEDGKLQFEPAITFGGGHYLVAWWEDDGTQVTIKGRVLNPDGSLVGTSNVALSSDTGFDAALAWNGSSFMASWIGYGDTPGIRVALVDSSGQVVSGSEHLVSTNIRDSHPALAVGTTGALVAWQDESASDFTGRLRAARLGLDGSVLDPEGFRLSSVESDENQASVAAAGDRFLVAWHRAGGGQPGSIRGTVIDSAGIAAPDFAISRSSGEASYPSVGFNGEAFAVAWKDERETPGIRGTLVTPEGSVSGAEDSLLSNVPATPGGYFDNTGIAWNGSNFLLVFQGMRSTGISSIVGIEGSFLGADLSVRPGPLGLSQLRAGEFAPQVVWDGRNYVVSWTDQRLGNFELSSSRAVRISSAGQVLDPPGIPLSDDAPGLGWTASNADRRTLVTLSEPSGSAQYRFLNANGQLSPKRPLADGVTGPVVAAGNGTSYLAVMTNAHEDYMYDLTGRVIRANGSAGPEFSIEPLTNGSGGVIATGDGYLVSSWTDFGKLFPVSANGVVGTPISLSLASTSLASATNGRRTLVAWTPGIGELPFAAQARFMVDGAFRGPTLEIAPTTAGSLAALAWDGRSYWAVWTVGDDSPRPFIRSISANGVLGPVSPVFEGECRGPALASNGRRQLLLSCYAYTNQYRLVTVSTRLIDTSSASVQ